MENLGYLFAAFAVVWVVLFGYVLTLIQRQKKLRREIDLLKEMPTKETPETGEFHYKETKEFRGQL